MDKTIKQRLYLNSTDTTIKLADLYNTIVDTSNLSVETLEELKQVFYQAHENEDYTELLNDFEEETTRLEDVNFSYRMRIDELLAELNENKKKAYITEEINKDLDFVEEALSIQEDILDSEIHSGFPTKGTRGTIRALKISKDYLDIANDLSNYLLELYARLKTTRETYVKTGDMFDLGMSAQTDRVIDELRKILYHK